MLAWRMAKARFEWDRAKDLVNQQKHGVAFVKAQLALPIPRVSSQKTSFIVRRRHGITVSVSSKAAC